MIFKKESDSSYWQFNLLLNCPEIVHGSFTRQGGYSQKPFASFNTSFDVGDDSMNVEKNLQLIKKSLKIKLLINTLQCHGDDIEIVNGAQTELKCDALITDQKNLGLMIHHADCQAALLYDPINRVIANVHAGWRGLQQKILSKTVFKMHQRFNTQPSNILVCFSPSLGPKYAQFLNFKKEWPEVYWKYQWKPFYFNLWAIAEDELKAAGVLSQHMERLQVCTYQNEQKCFSYRRNKKTGRHATVIGLC